MISDSYTEVFYNNLPLEGQFIHHLLVIIVLYPGLGQVRSHDALSALVQKQ